MKLRIGSPWPWPHLPGGPGISYHAAHFDVLMLKRPNECRRLLEEADRNRADGVGWGNRAKGKYPVKQNSTSTGN